MAHMQLFHISESADIQQFVPRLSSAYPNTIEREVVFAIEDRLLHNYLLPRDAPRVTFYATPTTTQPDQERFLGLTTATYVVVVESGQLQRIASTTLYCYEFPLGPFELLDPGAGYYIAYEPVTPLSIRVITNPLDELVNRSVELRLTPNLWKLADAVSGSSLQFSLIRMRNAAPPLPPFS